MTRLSVRLTPRSSRDAITGWRDGVLQARVTAPPVDGRANAALIRLLADALGVPAGSLTIVTGATARQKTVDVDDLDEAELRRRLSAPML